ncbi:class I mannose-6-phosphate isomerase [Croceibacterium sp. TMG7-5b_MA50]|uniref:class I mannose-6-phosphate isomerase n=1 Tax=Croceibacterium sp. TMG7-5b_MA50 TaxID=3121290 RepID=UPI0032215BEF
MLLPTKTVEKPWGMDTLPAPFTAPEGKRIGEIWFDPPAELPQLLVKYIFAGEKLSIQVHPSDTQTQAMGLGQQGKEECWLVIDADEGATLGIGFDHQLSDDELRAASEDGSIEQKMVWHQVKAGDFFYIPANTVHAIGGGVSIIEVQQNSDITYRLYDYGRPRELHLDDGVAVAQAGVHDPANRLHLPDHGDVALVDGPHFRVDRVDGTPDAATGARYSGPLLVIPRAGVAVVDGESVEPGGCALASSIEAVRFAADGSCLITQPLA